MFNLVAWIVSPNAAMGKDGFAGLSYRKATKISEIVQNIQSLVSGAQPSFNQILLSITMLAKTGSQMVVNNLKQLGHGLSNTETVFMQDKWAEWTERLKSIISSNIKKRVTVSHVFGNIHWKNKTLDRIETHHTNSILVQKYDLAENFQMCLLMLTVISSGKITDLTKIPLLYCQFLFETWISKTFEIYSCEE